MRTVDRVFDDGFDEVAAGSHRLQPGRLLTALVVVPLVLMLLGPRTGGAWAVALAACEAINWIVTRPFARGAPVSQGRRLAYLVSGVALHLCWVALSLLFWADPSPGAPFTAFIIWACVFLGGVSQAFRSRLGLIALTGPITVAMVAAPVIAPRFEGPQQAITVVGMLAFTAYGWVLARRNLASARSLAAAGRELAEQKQAAEAASLAKSAFLAMMSHELRTPMNGVLGMAHALEATALSASQQDHVRTLIRSGDGLMALLDDVLDLARIEAGKLEIVETPFDLHEVVFTAGRLWRPAAVEKGLDLACRVEEGAPAWVAGDPVRVRQILFNLLSNAIKFTAAGQVRLTLSPAPGGVVLAVADTGPGLDEAARATLFQRFSGAEAGGARRGGGVGLGLAISQDLARLMGGEIEVETQSGRGSEFRVRLPLAAVEPPLPAEPEAPPQVAPLRVLVVDDNSTNRAVASAILEALGATPHAEADGPAALALLRERAFDLVLMDIQMPGMDGVEVAARIRGGEAGDPQVPIMALTADAMAGARERLLGLGFDDYLTKPISPAVLAEALSRVEPRA